MKKITNEEIYIIFSLLNPLFYIYVLIVYLYDKLLELYIIDFFIAHFFFNLRMKYLWSDKQIKSLKKHCERWKDNEKIHWFPRHNFSVILKKIKKYQERNKEKS